VSLAAIDKNELLVLLRARVASRLEQLTSSQKAVQAGATHPDNKQEHAKDMRSTEASYLARGLAERVETMRDELRALELTRVRPFSPEDAAASGALVRLVDDRGGASIYFLSPAGAGEEIVVGGQTVVVITPRSPLGAELAGKECGDPVSVALPSGTLRAEIDDIA
jgi:transcription elongation GreA/GreB family factor